MGSTAAMPSSISLFSSFLPYSSKPSSSFLPSRTFPKPPHSISLTRLTTIRSELATLPILSFDGERIGETTLDIKSAHPDTARAVVHRGIITDLRNKRRGTASTLTRAEVRGGGRKPYPQKKTGRARLGSQRTPLRPGGGVVFGPKPKDWSVKINKKEKRLAISTALSSAAVNGIVVEEFGEKFEKPKTKEFISVMKRWGIDPKEKSMFFMTEVSENLELSSRNIGTCKMLTPRTLNLFDILNADKLVFTKGAVDCLNDMYGYEEYEDEDDEVDFEVEAEGKTKETLHQSGYGTPSRFRFRPNDEDCLFYLKEKVSGKPLPFQGMILELNPYAEEQLPDTFTAAKEKDLYFVTKLRRKGKVGQNIRIKDEHGSVNGISRKLIYWENIGSGKYHKGYRMTVYVLPTDETYDQLKDWVLCCLIKNHRWKDGKKVGKSASNSAANLGSSSSSMVADDFHTSKVEATPIHNLPLSTAVESHQTLAVLEYDNKELLDSLTMAYENIDPAARSGSPMAANNSQRCEVEATPINKLPHSAAVEIPPLQTLVAFEYGNHEELPGALITPSDNQVKTYDTVDPIAENSSPSSLSTVAYNLYTLEVEATPIHNLPLYTGVEIPPPQTLVDFQDEELHTAPMAIDFEDGNQLGNYWTPLEPLIGDEYWTTSELFPW